MSTCVKAELATSGTVAGQEECPGLTSPELSYASCEEISFDGDAANVVELSKRGELAMPLAGGGWSGDDEAHSGVSNCVSDPSTCDSKLTIAMRMRYHDSGLSYGEKAYYLSSGGTLPATGEESAKEVTGVTFYDQGNGMCCRILDGEYMFEFCHMMFMQERGKYVHLACVLEQSYKTRSRRILKMYVAGEYVDPEFSYGSVYVDDPQVALNTARAVVLGGPNDNPKVSNGKFEVDDLLFFDKALSAEEIKLLANNCGCLGGEAGAKPMLHWKLDARRDSAEDFSRLDALLFFTAMAWIFIPAYCIALHFHDRR